MGGWHGNLYRRDIHFGRVDSVTHNRILAAAKRYLLDQQNFHAARDGGYYIAKIIKGVAIKKSVEIIFGGDGDETEK